jgi:hypothetical protein
MADVPVNSENIQDITDKTKDLNDQLNKTIETAGNVSHAFLELKAIDFEKADNFFKGFDRSLDEASKGFGSIGKQWKEITENINNTPLSAAGDKLNALIGIAGKTGFSTAEISKAMSDFGTTAVDAAKGLVSLIGSHIQAAEAQNKMMHQIIDTSAATGNLNDIFGSQISTTADVTAGWQSLSKQLDNTREDITNLSNTTGVNQEVLAALYNQVAKLPNTFDETGKAVKGLNDAFQSGSNRTGFLDEITQIASGTGQSLNSVMEKIKEVRNTSNMNNQASLEFIARESDVSNKLGVSLDTVDSFMKEVSKSVGELGNNTDSSAKIFESFDSRLNQVGISAEKARSIIGNFTKGIADLDVVHRGFLSQQSGGPGGLAGGYKISNMIADGKLDEVAKMAEESLRKQMGGKIVSKEEAAQSETGAAQYTKQLMLLQQGPLGRFASNEQDAMKLLEGLTKENKGKDGAKLDLNDFKDKNDLLNQTLIRGQGIQNVTNTELTRLANSLNTWLYGAEKASAKEANTAFNDPNVTANQRAGSQIARGTFGDANATMGTGAMGAIDATKDIAKTAWSLITTSIGSVFEMAKNTLNDLLGQKNQIVTNKEEKAYFDAKSNNKTADTSKITSEKQKEIDDYVRQLQDAKNAKDSAEIQLSQEQQKEIARQASVPNPTNKPDAPKHNPPGSIPHPGTDHSSDQSAGTANAGGKKSSPGLNNAINDLNNLHLEVFITCPQCHEKHHSDSQAHASPTH